MLSLPDRFRPGSTIVRVVLIGLDFFLCDYHLHPITTRIARRTFEVSAKSVAVAISVSFSSERKSRSARSKRIDRGLRYSEILPNLGVPSEKGLTGSPGGLTVVELGLSRISELWRGSHVYETRIGAIRRGRNAQR